MAILFALILNYLKTAHFLSCLYLLLLIYQVHILRRLYTMNIKTFMQEVKGDRKEVKFDRFDEPIVIEAISEKENDRLKKAATKTRIAKGGRRISDLDTDLYTDQLIVRCVVSPDLDNAELQDFYGTQGDPAGTLKAMLLAGEYADITEKLLELNGFGDDENDYEEEVKK